MKWRKSGVGALDNLMPVLASQSSYQHLLGLPLTRPSVGS
jgi:hypothetical protein